MRGRARRVVSALAALAFALTGCVAHPPPVPGNCTLTIASGVDVSGGIRQRLVDRWNAANPDARACLRVISGVADEQRSEMIGAAQAESALYDVYNLDIQWIPEFAEGGHLRPLAVSLHDPVTDIPEHVWRAGSWHGTQYAAPLNTDVPLLYHRRTARMDTPPGSWQDMTEQVHEHRSEVGTRTGLAGQYGPYEGLVVNAMEAVWAAGGEWVDESGEVVIDSPGGRAGLDNLIRAVRPADSGTPAPVIPPHVLNHFEDDSLREFRDGHALFMRNWAYAYQVLSGEAHEGGPRFSATALPWPGVLGGQYLAVAATSRHPDLAQRLVAQLTGREAAALLYRCGGFAPARLSAFDADTACIRPQAGASTEPVSRIAPARLLKAALERVRVRPASPYYPQFSLVLRTELHRLLRCHASGGLDCESAAEFARRITPRLENALQGRVDG